MRFINTKDAAQPLGHYSQAIVSGNLVFVSGQIPVRPNGELETGSVSEQAKVVLNNVDHILIAAGSSRSKVVKVTVYMSDIAYWPELNVIYGEFFGDHKPARSAIPTNGLPKGAAVEIEVIAEL
jgi:2-iminobutanoate/2-iminopropanoate deaminase